MPSVSQPGPATFVAAPVRWQGRSREEAWRCGDWLCLQMIGSGRWTTVHRARPASAPETHPADYVLKVLREDVRDIVQARQTLQRDAQVAAQVSHPRLSVVLATHLEKSPYYLVLPFLEGLTLGAYFELRDGAPRNSLGNTQYLPLPRALWIVRQVAEGLAELHRCGWLHGDIKPSNIMFAPRGEVTLIDFGLSRLLNSPECRATENWHGTLRYAPPESFVSHHRLTSAADTYSLGLILFELLTNHSPLAGISAEAVALAQLERPLPDLQEQRRDLPPKLVRLVKRMTAKEPLRRPTDEELVAELVALEIETFGEL